MTEIAEAAVPGLRERVLWREVLPPADMAQTGAAARRWRGREGRFLRPGNRTRIPGLYAVGGWSHPGGGPAHAGMSGAIVAGLIVNGDDWSRLVVGPGRRAAADRPRPGGRAAQ